MTKPTNLTRSWRPRSSGGILSSWSLSHATRSLSRTPFGPSFLLAFPLRCKTSPEARPLFGTDENKARPHDCRILPCTAGKPNSELLHPDLLRNRERRKGVAMGEPLPLELQKYHRMVTTYQDSCKSLTTWHRGARQSISSCCIVFYIIHFAYSSYILYSRTIMWYTMLSRDERLKLLILGLLEGLDCKLESTYNGHGCRGQNWHSSQHLITGETKFSSMRSISIVSKVNKGLSWPQSDSKGKKTACQRESVCILSVLSNSMAGARLCHKDSL